MTATHACPRCGAALPAGAPEGLCPRCLLGAGLPTDDPAATAAYLGGIEPPLPAELARFFPQLEVLELIGHGGMGAVYKARQPALDRFVALKVVLPGAAGGAEFAERFQREARALARLHHPGIVGVYDFGQVGGLFYFLMEYVDGTTLRQVIHAGGVAPAEALAIIPQLCDALEYAHSEGVVHRDIKPENVLIDRKGRVKVADFGLAKLLHRRPADLTLTREGQVMGTVHYMAPEQIESPLAVDHRADIYSMGVVFYELLTGKLPLGRFPPPSQKAAVDRRLDGVVMRALEREPAQRYQHAGEVKTEVEAIAHTPPPRGPAAVIPTLERLQRFLAAPQPDFAERVGKPMLYLLAAWVVVTAAVMIWPFTRSVSARETLGSLLAAGSVLLPGAGLLLTLFWAIDRGRPRAEWPPVVGWVRALGLAAVVVLVPWATVETSLPTKRDGVEVRVATDLDGQAVSGTVVFAAQPYLRSWEKLPDRPLWLIASLVPFLVLAGAEAARGRWKGALLAASGLSALAVAVAFRASGLGGTVNVEDWAVTTAGGSPPGAWLEHGSRRPLVETARTILAENVWPRPDVGPYVLAALGLALTAVGLVRLVRPVPAAPTPAPEPARPPAAVPGDEGSPTPEEIPRERWIGTPVMYLAAAWGPVYLADYLWPFDQPPSESERFALPMVLVMALAPVSLAILTLAWWVGRKHPWVRRLPVAGWARVVALAIVVAMLPWGAMRAVYPPAADGTVTIPLGFSDAADHAGREVVLGEVSFKQRPYLRAWELGAGGAKKLALLLPFVVLAGAAAATGRHRAALVVVAGGLALAATASFPFSRTLPLERDAWRVTLQDGRPPAGWPAEGSHARLVKEAADRLLGSLYVKPSIGAYVLGWLGLGLVIGGVVGLIRARPAATAPAAKPASPPQAPATAPCSPPYPAAEPARESETEVVRAPAEGPGKAAPNLGEWLERWADRQSPKLLLWVERALWLFAAFGAGSFVTFQGSGGQGKAHFTIGWPTPWYERTHYEGPTQFGFSSSANLLTWSVALMLTGVYAFYAAVVLGRARRRREGGRAGD